MKFKRKSYQNLILILVLLSLFIFLNSGSMAFQKYSDSYQKEDNQRKIKTSGYWNFKSIYIDNDTSNANQGTPNGTWSWAKSQPWCKGKGTWNEPFIIENISIAGDFSINGIEIRDSSVPFIIRNCTITQAGAGGSFDAGIKLSYANNGLIEKNNCTDNDGAGILVFECDNNTLYNNTVKYHQSHMKEGIYLQSSSNTTILENHVSQNLRGIFLSHSYNNTILKNNASNNWQDGINVWNGDENIVKENRIADSGIDHGINLNNANNNTIFNNTLINNERGISLYDCHDNLINYNNVSEHTGNSDRGIYLEKSNFNEIVSNNLTNNYYNLHLTDCENNSISFNYIIDGSNWGLYIHDSVNNTVDNNIIKKNPTGISIGGGSKNNTINENEIIDNTNYGIYINWFCTANYLWDNEIENSLEGIRILSNCNQTTIISNTILQCQNYGINIINSSNRLCYDTSVYKNIFNNPSATKNAQDNGTDTKWDDGIVGNYWHDYSGIDLNDDGIGDTPFIIDLFKGIVDNYPIWTDTDDIAPKITILTPSDDSLFTKNDEPPNFNVQVLDQTLDTKWYTIDNGSTNFTFTNDQGLINNTAWKNIPDGDVTITFYANDSVSRISTKSVKILKDTNAPSITIKSPLENATINGTSPEFSLKIFDPLLDWSWYTINDGTKIFNFTGTTIQIDQVEWDNLPDGIVNITFHANDTLARLSDLTIQIIKDTLLPALDFKGTNINGTTIQNSPNFTITITETYLDSVWVKIFEKGANQTYIQKINTSTMLNIAANSDSYDIPIQINETTWNSFQDGEIELTVYANDTAGNIGSMNILITKGSSEGSGGGIPFGSVYMIITIVALVSTILVYKTKQKKSIL